MVLQTNPKRRKTNCGRRVPTYGQVHNTLLTKSWVNRGLKLYKEGGDEAVLKELSKLHEKGSVDPNDPKKNDEGRKSV